MRVCISAFCVGLLFALGLGVSGMAQPAVVLGFLDVTGNWNPSLILVMGGAIGISLPVYQWLFRRSHPLFSVTFNLPIKKPIDRRLLLGSALFGIGWGLSGYCPGTGIVAVAGGTWEALTFSVSMLLGFYWFNRREKVVASRTALGEAP